jgi:cyclophilin family peptidyl-prolyl cis-trans isomerase
MRSLFLLLAAAMLAAQTPPAREPGLYSVMTTSMGTITFLLYEKEAPLTVKNFVDLATGSKTWTDPRTKQKTRKPLYNGLTFHRVIPGFMIQGGDPLGNGMGDAGFEFKDEFHPTLRFDRPGRLAMANSGPNTNSCQFFVTEVPTPHLNNLHTIFGQVVNGQDLIGKMARVPRLGSDKPRTPIVIQSVKFERVFADGKVEAVTGTAPAAPKPASSKKAAAPTPAAPASKK